MVSLNVSCTYSSDERFQAFKLKNSPEIVSIPKMLKIGYYPFRLCESYLIKLCYSCTVGLNLPTLISLETVLLAMLNVDSSIFTETDLCRLRNARHVRILLKAFRKFFNLHAYTNGFTPELAITRTNWMSLTQ